MESIHADYENLLLSLYGQVVSHLKVLSVYQHVDLRILLSLLRTECAIIIVSLRYFTLSL